MSDLSLEDLYPLTPLQRGMLFHSVLAPDAGDYLAQLDLVIEGELDPDAFEGAWQAVLARHPALRTAFVWEGVDEPVQAVLRRAELPFERVDRRGLSDAEQRARHEDYLRADRRRGFVLARAPLARVHLARLADAVWRVTFTSHHLLLDGWSLPLVLREVFAGHAAAGRNAPFEPPPVRPYRDYLAWLAAREREPAKAFWEKRLRDLRPTPLPGVRERALDAPAAQERAGEAAPERVHRDDWGDVYRSLSAGETRRLGDLARRSGLTLATLVQGAFALWLARQSGRREVIFGVVRSGRPPELEGVESMVGMFVNTLPLDVAVPERGPVLAWLKRVQAHAAELAPHEWTALTDVARWCGLEPGTPLFESLVVFENYPFSDGEELAGSDGEGPAGTLALREVTSLERTSYPVNLIATPRRKLSLRLSHDPARMDGALAERWLAGVSGLLLRLVERPDADLSELASLDADERRTLLEWARGPELGREPTGIAELFEAQAARSPEATALECDGRSLTYRELDAAASGLARRLAERGVGRESVVGLALERTPELAVAILASQKAGAAWTALDPAHPPARLEELAEGARVEVVITERALAERCRGLERGARAVLLFEDLAAPGEPAREDAAGAPNFTRPVDLAYVIHTSGSTGAPKGVEVSQRGVEGLVLDTAQAARLGPGRRVAQLSAVGFDVSVIEILGALLTGSTLCLPGRDRAVPGPELAARLRASGVQVLFAPPSVLRELDPSGLPELDTVFIGGEACSAELAAAWGTGRRIVHAYGPAEATVTATQAIGRGTGERGGGPPAPSPPPSIGRPIRGVRAYVLDRELRLAPIGAVGELFLGGAGVARGYRGRPALTAERFLPDPFGDEPGARLYRTGDLARWRPAPPGAPHANGAAELEFCGRADRQLKVRGVRVEPGEVEAALLAHPGVAAAAVDAVEVGGEPRLAAWCVARPGAKPSAGEVRGHLARRLPPALVPSYVEWLAALPLSPSGKLDRARLPRPAERERESLPRETTPLEELLSAEAAAVLGLRAVRPEDDFFALGGHSLRAMQLVSRVRAKLFVDLPLGEVFAASTLADLARRLEALRKRGAPAGALLPAVAEFAGHEGPRPLSFAQQRLWFLDRFAPESALYVVPAGVRLEGPVDTDALERALGRLVARHGALRTRFDEGPDEPRQVVLEHAPVRLERVDLRGEASPETLARELALAEARRPFDLSAPPLLRASIFRLADDEHLLVLALHHVAVDGWSVGILLRDLARLYAGETGAGPAELPEPAEPPEIGLGYGDWAAWQRDPRVEAWLETRVAFWERELEGAPPALDLPCDHPRPPVQTFGGRSLGLSLEPELCRRVEQLARRRGATPFMVLLAAFDVWLSRLSGQDDLVVGVPVAGRTRAELEPIVGLFVNTLPLRARLGDDPSFRVHLERTRERVLAAWDHQDAPFERMVERVTSGRDLSRAPLVQVLFAMQNVSVPRFELAGLGSELLDLDTGTSKFDLSLFVDEPRLGAERPAPGEGGLELTLEYATDLFAEETMREWLASFRELVRSAVADPERRVSELEWLSDEALERLAELGRAPATHPREATVPELFEAQALRTPEATAVVFGGRSLSYRELDRRANRLARRLRALGVGPEVRVAIGCERSLEMVVALVATLKAGGAYVPLDPQYPSERRRWMLAASGAPLLLTQRARREDFPAPGGVRTLLVDEDPVDDDPTGGSSEPLAPLARAENLAYVMYTSGSTGVPKGVGVSHRAVARLVAGEPFVELGPGEVVLQFVSVAFDVSVFEIFGPLVHGARLEVFPPHLPSLAELGAFVRERGVTTLWLTTGLFDQMIDGASPDLRGVRQLLAGGEALSAPHVERALAELPGCRLVNGYGPTEVTCFTTTHRFAPGEPVPSPVPIGRPINGTRVFVLDRHLQPVPRGVRGELYAAGDGLARGYVNDAALSAARFVPDPFAEGPGGRLYRTGDQVRWRTDGTLEFAGRADRQVKVRGYRIELGEIEAALAEHPAVRQCVVELRGAREDARPVAWIVASPAPSARELRDFLRRKLPEPVLPALFVTLDALPLTPNGKLDRRALPEPDLEAEAGDGGGGDARPRTPAEELLAAEWADLLGCGRVGTDDDFFELGGHSLLATRLVARIRDVFGVELALQRVFDHSTLGELARAVAATLEGPGGERSASEPAIPRASREEPLSLSFAQERLWFLERYAPANPAHHTPIALELLGELDADALERAFEELVRRHETLRTRIREVDGRPVQEIAPAESVTFELARQDLSVLAPTAREARLHEISEAEMRRPFDLERDLALRAHLARLASDRHVLSLALHHIACDGWSLSVLLRELAALYRAAREGLEPSLPVLELQYADYALWQRHALAGERAERLFEWWREELAGAAERLQLGAPSSGTASRFEPGQLRPGRGFEHRLPRELARQLERLARREGATLFMLLLASFQALLGRTSGRRRFVVGSPIAGRTRRETEGTVGPFVNLVALVADLEADPSFCELLARVRRATLGAYAHAELPVERLAHLLRPDGDPRGGELFQVTFTFHNTPRARLELDGLETRRLDVHTGVAFGELWLSVEIAEDGALEAYWHYDAGLFEGAAVERLAAGWVRVLEGAVAAPDARLHELPLLDEGERARLLALGRAPSTHPREASVVDLFERAAMRTPDAPAVGFEGDVTTYRELAEHARRLARRLCAFGVGPEVPVAIVCERSLEMVVGLLGILEAGGAYVALDPALPERRLARALELSGAPLVLTESRLVDLLPASAPGAAFVLALDDEWDAIARESAEPLERTAGPENLAYVTFTSGSTGEPKAVGVCHRSVVRLVAGEPFAQHAEGEVVAQFAPLAFDASTFEIFWPLVHGGRLDLFPPRPLGLQELGALFRERGITTAWLTAGLFHQMIDERAEDLRGLRQLLAGGEALSPAHVARALEALPGCRLINGYGPTEVTTFTACHAIDAAPEGSSVPIGRPINGTEVYVLDESLELAPFGAWGELCAGGDGLSRGYLGDPRLTAERFVPSPFARERGARLYRTGDRARWREEGTLEFGGRLDRQIKLRGFRIEPGEVEAALAEHPGVRAAAVDVRGEGAQRRLSAFVVPEGELELARLGEHLRSRLPAYAVPASVTLLEELPLTPNGKLDRAALRERGAPDPADARSADGAPRTPEEELLAGLWSTLLGRDSVARDEDFFELGGHSLIATQLASRVRELFGVELPLGRIFESPTVAELAAVIASLRSGERETWPEIVSEQAGEVPLSFGQERLWFLERLDPGRAVYHVPFALELAGPLEPEALRASLAALARRHEALRTSFPARDGRPRQEIAPASPEGPGSEGAELALVDLSHLEPDRRGAELARLERAAAREPFDLERGPLWRATLVRRSAEDHVLLLVLHHAICDGWSLSILTRELSELMGAELAGREPRLGALPRQPREHALWQRGFMDGERLERELDWWRAELEGARPERLELGSRPQGTWGDGERGALLETELPPELGAELDALARREGATLFMVLLAAFQALLARLSGADTVLVGAPIAGRNRRESEGLVGFLVNTLALRADLTGRPSFRELVAQVRARTLGAYDHQDLPFERLVVELWPDLEGRGDSPLPLLFALQNAPPARVELPGLEVLARPLATGEPHAELFLAVERAGPRANGSGGPEEGSLVAAWEYDADRFERCEIEALAALWRALLEHAVRSPEEPLESLPLLAGPERARELERSRGGRGGYAREEGLFERFERRALERPDALAVVAGRRELTYGELLSSATAVAAALVRAGVRREERVGLVAGRADRLALGALAILRADAAWVALDPAVPDERTRRILADAGVARALCDDEHRARFEELGVRCFGFEELERAGARMPDVRGRGAGLAYVTYTSGSTGEPKGVAVPQRAVARLVADGPAYAGLGPGHRVARASNPAFDAVTFELFGPLLAGATLVELERETLLSPSALAAALAERAITHLFLTTAVFQQTVLEEPRAFATLERLFFGGERSDPDVVRALVAAGAPRHLVHVYGPTETTTFASWHEVRELDADARHVPIGGPIEETDLYVLDESLEPVPAGLVGELCIGGDGLARGYLGRGAATAASFVPNPFAAGGAGEGGSRLYRTGDRVRRDPEGRLEFLGRRDEQIKLRGLRIEPGEVEAALERHPDVRQAVVALRRTPEGDARLVAWVVREATGAAPPDAEALRRALAERLPAYMVPAHFVFQERFALGRTGKVERRSLADPQWREREGARPGAEDEPLAGPLEEVVASIWCDVLGVERVGPNDDFFELGGHSLSAARVMARLSAALGSELALRALFEAPTVRGLAARAEAARGASKALPALPPAGEGPREGPLSFAQERLWFLQRLAPASAFYHVPIALRVRGPLDEERLERALEAFVARHETLRTRVVTVGGEPRQVVDPPGPVRVERWDLRALEERAREKELARRLELESAEPIDLSLGPPWRASLIRLEPEHSVLAFVVHHAMADGWSLGIMMRELGALVADASSELPPLETGYLEFARWQRERLAGERGERRIAWWRERLDGAPAALELFPDRPRPAVQTFRGGSVPVALAPDLSRGLRELAAREGATPFMVLCAGFVASLARRSGANDVSVGTPVAGRDRPELEGLFGLFVDTLVLRTDLSGDPSFRELVQRVRATALEAFEHRDVPFEKVVEAARPERDTSRSPLFQVMFALQNAPLEPLSVAGATIEPLELPGTTAKFDLTLALGEEGESFAGALEYDAALFERATAEGMAASFRTLLGSALAEPDRPLSRLGLLPAEARERVLALGCGPRSTAIAGPSDAVGVHRLFEQRARETPHALAVADGARQLTYGELESRANGLAWRLRALGVGPEVAVGLCVERSLELALGALAVLKAGGAYVALDPERPAERTREMLRDARAKVWLVAGSAASVPGDGSEDGPRVVRLEALDIDGESDAPPAWEATPGSAAYVVYTSGSTGRPKGVVVPHAGLSNLVAWHVGAYGLGLGDRTSLVAGTSFDASVWELWPALAAGASLHVVPRDARLDPPRLVRWMTEAGITVGFLPTPLAEAVLEIEWPRDAALRALLVGGDRLHGPGGAPRAFELVNHYGPSEVSVVTSAERVPAGSADAGPPPIGRPIAGLRAYVLDAELEPVPIGAPGELYVTGAGLARGYLGRPRRTAEAFVPNPHADQGGERLYRTGDIVRWNAEGRLSFLGRADRQVKVAGQRLELGEVEALLLADPDVREAAVLARAGERGATELVAYVAAKPERRLEFRSLSERLRRRLPRALVPSHWVALESLPLSASGKIDRAALPALEERAGDVLIPASPPSTPTERTVASVWCTVLGRTHVDTRTNFFDLGGTSLALLEVQARLLADLDRDVPVIELFRYPTVESLAHWLDHGEDGASAPGTRRAERRREARGRRR